MCYDNILMFKLYNKFSGKDVLFESWQYYPSHSNKTKIHCSNVKQSGNKALNLFSEHKHFKVPSTEVPKSLQTLNITNCK